MGIKDDSKNIKANNQAMQQGIVTAAALTEEARNLGQELKDMLGIRQRINDYDKALLNIGKSITQASQENKEALGDAGNITKQILKETASIDAINRERLISEKTVTLEQKNQAKALNAKNQKRIENLRTIDSLRDRIVNAEGAELTALTNKLSIAERINGYVEEDLAKASEGLDKDTQRLALVYGMGKAAAKNLAVSTAEEEAQARIKDSLGVSGKILGALKKNFGGFAEAIGVDKIAKDMEDAAIAAERKGKALSRSQTLAIGLGSALGGLTKTLTDPTVILGAMLKGFKEVDKAAVDFQRTTGQDGNTFALQIDAANSGFITMVDYLKTATALTKELGMNATNIFTPADLQEASRIEHYMGMTAKQANQLAIFSKTNGKSLKENNEALVAGVNSFNGQNKAGILAKGVLEDVANVSQDIGILYTGYPEKLGAAGAAAAAMGSNLAGVKKLAEGLLDFENSIAAEMEAELLTGKQLNLEKARQFALSNDLEGVAKELSNQGITQASFSKMNAIQQQAQAKALGMSTEEMAKMLIRQSLSLGMSEKGLSDAQKQTLEQMKQEEASKKMEAAMAKISQALAPLVDILADIITPLAGFLSNTKILVPLLAAIGVSKIGGVAKHFTAMKDSIGGALKNLKGLGSGIKSMATGGGAGKLKETLGFGAKTGGMDKKLGGLKKGTTGLNAKLGKSVGGFLKAIAKGLMSLANPAVILGVAVVTLAIMGFGKALGMAAPGIKAFGVVISSVFAGIGTLITSVADGFVKLMGAISMENIGPLLLLGPALLGISAGLASMAVTGIMALPAIAGLVALSLVAAPLIRLAELGVIGDGGGGGGEEDDGNSMIADKLDQLIAIVEKGGDIFLDGNKVGRNLAIASSKIG